MVLSGKASRSREFVVVDCDKDDDDDDDDDDVEGAEVDKVVDDEMDVDVVTASWRSVSLMTTCRRGIIKRSRGLSLV